MKHLLFFFIVFFAFVNIKAQTLHIEATSESAANDINTFSTQSGQLASQYNVLEVTGSDGSFSSYSKVSVSVAPSGEKIGIIEQSSGFIKKTVDHRGVLLTETELEFLNEGDETVSGWQFTDGRFIVRENVSLFTYIDAEGNIQFNRNNSSGSQDGESVSRFASDNFGTISVIYNPVIHYGNERGSRARVVFHGKEPETFQHSESRTISFLKVHPESSFIVIITKGAGDDEVSIYDRFGNELTIFTSEMELLGADITDDGKFATIFSERRAQIYNVLTGERLGSASTRSNIVYASYQPADNLVVLLTGDHSERVVQNPGITAVHLTRRQIVSESIGFDLSYLDFDEIRLDRISSERYQLEGVNRPLRIRSSF